MFETAIEFQVNDSILAQKKKICYKDILAVVAEMLKQQKFQIKDISLVWLSFSQKAAEVIRYRSPRTDGFHAGYFLDLEPWGGDVVFGFYQPFSGKVYVVKSECLDNVKAVSGNLQFVLSYHKTQTSRDCFDVKRLSRCFSISQEMLSSNQVLTACEDREILKTVLSTHSSLAEDAFYEKELFHDMKHNSPMFFNKF